MLMCYTCIKDDRRDSLVRIAYRFKYIQLCALPFQKKMIYFPTELFLVVEPLSIYGLPLMAEVRFSEDAFSNYPPEIQVSSQQVSYRLLSRYYAVHYSQPQAAASEAILQLNDGAIAVFSGAPHNVSGTVSPVYTLSPNGSLAVPTGLIFIRFAEGVKVESHQADIKLAGYEIAETLAYAPNAAWLRAQSGQILAALLGIAKLEALADVENVEPQMLMASVGR